MGKPLQKKQKEFYGGTVRRAVPESYATRKQVMGPYGPIVIKPSRLPRGWQDVRLHIPTRIATCAEDQCPFFLNGWTDPVTGREIPAGTPCGRTHRVWNGKPPIYYIQYGGEEIGRFVTQNEFIDNLCAGLDLSQEIAQGRR